MSGRVIQARYLGGRPGPQLLQLRPVGTPPLAGAVQAKGRPGLAGPPPLVGHAVQAGRAPVAPSRALQAHGAAESFAVDPVRLGLGQGRGRPLPDAVRAKMEAAFNTDFSGVRVHEGPQAARIGAIAFTTGHDIYFAPGQYRPETVQGQQLLGHELAHVVQQRQGRVKAPGSGVSVVQDHALEAEADRLGMRAALQRRAKVQVKSEFRSLKIAMIENYPDKLRATRKCCCESGGASLQPKIEKSINQRCMSKLIQASAISSDNKDKIIELNIRKDELKDILRPLKSKYKRIKEEITDCEELKKILSDAEELVIIREELRRLNAKRKDKKNHKEALEVDDNFVDSIKFAMIQNNCFDAPKVTKAPDYKHNPDDFPSITGSNNTNNNRETQKY